MKGSTRTYSSNTILHSSYLSENIIEKKYHVMFLIQMFVIFYLADFDSLIMTSVIEDVMMFTCGTHKIAMAPILHFDKSLREKKTGYLVMTQNEKELDDASKEIECFCPVVSKGLMSVVKEDVSIPQEVLEILGHFNELIADELPNISLP